MVREREMSIPLPGVFYHSVSFSRFPFAVYICHAMGVR